MKMKGLFGFKRFVLSINKNTIEANIFHSEEIKGLKH